MSIKCPGYYHPLFSSAKYQYVPVFCVHQTKFSCRTKSDNKISVGVRPCKQRPTPTTWMQRRHLAQGDKGNRRQGEIIPAITLQWRQILRSFLIINRGKQLTDLSKVVHTWLWYKNFGKLAQIFGFVDLCHQRCFHDTVHHQSTRTLTPLFHTHTNKQTVKRKQKWKETPQKK